VRNEKSVLDGSCEELQQCFLLERLVTSYHCGLSMPLAPEEVVPYGIVGMLTPLCDLLKALGRYLVVSSLGDDAPRPFAFA
jgi:hypothetical protein